MKSLLVGVSVKSLLPRLMLVPAHAFVQIRFNGVDKSGVGGFLTRLDSLNNRSQAERLGPRGTEAPISRSS